jgi:hypothetical protein
MRWLFVLIGTLTFVPACTSSPAPPDAAAPADAGVDALDAFRAPDAYAPPDAPGVDAAVEPDAFVSPDAFIGPDAATQCSSAGYVCIPMILGSCAMPNVLHFMLTCQSGYECCQPATGVPAPCANSGGTCITRTPISCQAPSHYGEREIYFCPDGQDCCLPPGPGM